MRNFFILLTSIALILPGCRVHRGTEFCIPEKIVPEEFCHQKEGVQTDCHWWKEFNSSELNEWMDEALYENLEISQAWHRLLQAQQEVRIQNAGKIPALDLEGSVNYTYRSGSLAGLSSGSSGFNTVGSNTRYSIGPVLSYEVDLWKKIDSAVKASCFTAQAKQEDLEATALVITGRVANTWLDEIEKYELLALLNHQIDVNRTFLDLIELRFSVGQASALDVYQQRLQLAQTEAEVPPVRAALEVASHQLSVLSGKAPECADFNRNYSLFPKLPEFPHLETPCDLLSSRPDLKSAYASFQSADEEVAVAIADQYPQVSLLLSYEFSALKAGRTLEQQLFSALGNVLAPIFDAGKRKAEVCKRRAVVYEKLDAFKASVLNALQEVEDSIATEREQIALLERLKVQRKLADENLREARLRYATGLDDYLSVIAAIQALQRVERLLITESKILLQNRGKLYRSLGGNPLI